MYVLLEFWQKIIAIPIMNPLSWFMMSFLINQIARFYTDYLQSYNCLNNKV